ncbi:MAG: ABC transporter permease [Bdellovibrio sp.]
MIKIRDVRKSYTMGDNVLEVLKGVSLTIEDGDFVAIMGPSGSGKSTLMNILGLLDVPSSGSYELHGTETAYMSEDELAVFRRDEIGFIFQQFNLLPRMSALENVCLPLLYSKKENGREQARTLLEKVSLSSRAGHKPNELSGGQQQRVAIARSMVNGPQIIFADEPTGNLDSKSEKEILQLLKDLNAQGITVIMVTHEEEIGAQARRLIRLRDGVIQSDERRDEFKEGRGSAETSPKVRENKASSWDFISYFEQGLRTLLANKARTFLSMLGVLMGVAAVVAMLAVGKGAQKSIESQLSSLGSNLLVVRPGAQKVGGVSQEATVGNRLRFEDAAQLKAKASHIKNISAQTNGRGQITALGLNWNTQVQAVSPSWAELHTSVPVSGRFFTEEENQKRARVVVIGETVRREIFGDKNPIGENVKINKVIFQVIGLLPAKGASGFRDQDDVAIVPVLTGMYRLFGKTYVDMLEVEVDAAENISATEEEVTAILSSSHKVPLSQQSDAFQIRNMAELQSALQESSQTMSLLLSSIAAISLLVGGIGIMNIMLVSVTERTKEIGLRKAIGACRRDILTQFLSESVVISLTGGLAGIALGWMITWGLSLALGWGTSISWGAVALAFIFSAAIGVVFGVYPAYKASRLNPIEALRFE